MATLETGTKPTDDDPSIRTDRAPSRREQLEAFAGGDKSLLLSFVQLDSLASSRQEPPNDGDRPAQFCVVAGWAPAGAVGDNRVEPPREQPDHVVEGGGVEARDGGLRAWEHQRLIARETAQPFSYVTGSSKRPSP